MKIPLQVEPKDIIEYEWPVKSGDRWFLQEQIGELLDIKSFSRKYPDFTRRKVNHEEREFLEWNFNVHKLLNETCMCRSSASSLKMTISAKSFDCAEIH